MRRAPPREDRPSRKESDGNACTGESCVFAFVRRAGVAEPDGG